MSESYSGTKFKTIFKNKKILKSKKIKELIKWCKKFSKLGFANAANKGHPGNLSTKTSKGFIITAAGYDLGTLNKKDFVEVIKIEKNKVYVNGIKEPSSESFIHNEVYKKRSDIKSVFHGHDKLTLKSKSLPITKKEKPYGSISLAKEVAKVLDNNNYILIKNHGFVSLGETIEAAGDEALKQHKKIS